MNINLELSREVGRTIGAKDKDCFFNSVMAVAAMPDGAVYVEGYGVADDFRIICEHGWVEFNGEIIDPTPAWNNDRTTRKYFPVRRYTLAEIRSRLHKRRKTTLPFAAHFWQHDDFLAAHDEASKYAYGEAQYKQMKDFQAKFQKSVKA